MLDHSRVHLLNSRYGQVRVFRHDVGAVTESLRTYSEWAENELSFLRSVIPKGATVLDVGAYIGTHTLAFSQFVGPQGRVISIEAQPAAFELLTSNVSGNNLRNVLLEHAVAYDKLGSAKIVPIDLDHDDNFGSAAVHAAQDERGAAGEVVPTISTRRITIDSLKLEACSLIKIDAEGTESIILRGAKETLSRTSPIIYAECNSVKNGYKTLKVLNNAGYKVFMHVVDAFNPDNFAGNRKNIFGHAREVALVAANAADKAQLRKLERATPRSCELFLEIETLDDLVLGMLNKPQYQAEILRPSLAAQAGGDRWLDAMEELRLAEDRQLRELQTLRDELAAARAERSSTVERLSQAAGAARDALGALQAERDSTVERLSQVAGAAQAALGAVQAERDSTVTRLSQEVAAARNELAAAQAEHAATVERLRQEAMLARAEHASAVERLDREVAVRGELAATRTKLADAREEHASIELRLNEELSTANGELSAAYADFEARETVLRQEVADAKAALVNQQEEFAAIQGWLRIRAQRSTEALVALRAKFDDVRSRAAAELFAARRDAQDSKVLAENAMRQARFARQDADRSHGTRLRIEAKPRK